MNRLGPSLWTSPLVQRETLSPLSPYVGDQRKIKIHTTVHPKSRPCAEMNNTCFGSGVINRGVGLAATLQSARATCCLEMHEGAPIWIFFVGVPWCTREVEGVLF